MVHNPCCLKGSHDLYINGLEKISNISRQKYLKKLKMLQPLAELILARLLFGHKFDERHVAFYTAQIQPSRNE